MFAWNMYYIIYIVLYICTLDFAWKGARVAVCLYSKLINSALRVRARASACLAHAIPQVIRIRDGGDGGGACKLSAQVRVVFMRARSSLCSKNTLLLRAHSHFTHSQRSQQQQQAAAAHAANILSLAQTQAHKTVQPAGTRPQTARAQHGAAAAAHQRTSISTHADAANAAQATVD